MTGGEPRSGGAEEPLVTVIVPGFDVAPYAAEAIDSLRAQTLTAWRAILIDDASADGTGALFRQAAEADPRFTAVSLDRRSGLGAARNAGLDLVGTPFVAFLDADDVLTPTALERLIATLDASGSDFAVGAYVRLRPVEGSYAADGIQPWVAAATSLARTATTIDEHPQATGNIVAWSKASRADFWRRTGIRFPEGRLYEDQVVAQLMYSRARAFDVIPDVVVQWRVRADGSSITQREADLAVLRDCLDAMRAGLSVLEEGGHAVAVQARIGLILRMDVPRLAGIAREHPDAAYRRALGAFTRSVWDRAGAARAGAAHDGLDAETRRIVEAVALW